MNKLGYILAPKELVKNKLAIRYMYREMPDNPQDSGWRFFSGTESDEYVNNPDNIGIYDISTVVRFCADIIPYLNSPYGSEYERVDSTPDFVLVQL